MAMGMLRLLLGFGVCAGMWVGALEPETMIGKPPAGTSGEGKPRQAVHANDFGADPTGVQDSTAAIQAAVDYASSLVKPHVKSPGDRIDGATVHLRGVYRVTEPIFVRTSNVCLDGDGGATLLPYFTSAAGYNGAKPVLVIGTGTVWQTSGSIPAANKYNRVEGLMIKRAPSPNLSFVGILVSGTRNAVLRDLLVEEGLIGVLCENTSEALIQQVSTIGCNWGFVFDSRKDRPAAHSVLNVTNSDNDVSSMRADMITAYYPQHTGVLAFDTGTHLITGCTIGCFSDSPSSPTPLGFPAAAVGLHVTGGTTGPGTTRGMLVQDVVFEASQSSPRDCIRVDAANQHAVFGVTFDNCTVQTWKSYSLTDLGKDTATTLLRVGQGGEDIVGLTLRKSGYMAQSAGYFYGRLVDCDTAPDLLVQDCFPSITLASSNLGSGGHIDPVEYVYRIDPSAGFTPPGWTSTNVNGSSLITNLGDPTIWRFTGTTTDAYITRSFSFNEYQPGLAGPIVTFLCRGDGDLTFVAEVNGAADTLTTAKNTVNASRYSNALVDPNVTSTSTWRRVTFTFNQFDANYGFHSMRIWVGRKANASLTKYVDICDLWVGYFEGGRHAYNPFER
jgi:hypothetical protein